MVEEEKCRLCDGKATYLFESLILNKYLIKYFKCNDCNSLVVEKPFWLAELYQQSNISEYDVGAANRVVNNFLMTAIIANIFAIKHIVDFGGGDGLLCRLLRDIGFDAYRSDKYAKNTYANGFEARGTDLKEMFSAFEVLEHFAEPSSELAYIFTSDYKVLIFSTEIYNNQASGWDYLSPETGQHLFFYSSKAIDYLGQKYDYQYSIIGNFIVFYRDINKFKIFIINILKVKILRLFLKYLYFVIYIVNSPSNIKRDHIFVKKCNK